MHAFAAQAWPLTVGSLDWVARQLAESVVSFQGSDVGAPPRRKFFVTNTQDCRMSGSHWISIAIELRWDLATQMDVAADEMHDEMR